MRVPEPSLAEGVKILENPTFEASKSLKQASQRKMTGKALKDVTNKMETSPIKFKPYWTEPRATHGTVTREIPVSKKKNTELGPMSLADTTTKINFTSVINGPYSARPPDLTQPIHKVGALNKPQLGATRQVSGDQEIRASSNGDRREGEILSEARERGSDVGVTGKNSNLS